MQTASGDHEIEWILSLSSRDKLLGDYHQTFIESDAILLELPTKNMVEATNKAAKVCAGELIILVSDDMFSCEMWDTRMLHKYEMIDGPGLLQVYDGITTKKITIPIMNREAYAKLGYVYHPDYKSMFADDDLRATAIKHQMYYNASDIYIEHRHYSVGKAVFDKTYQSENDHRVYIEGERTYFNRAKLNFPL
jgi:hypothetical protein